jgi:phosphopantothenoylcysteine decarboxylase/phosphopantothenate--cysteine ligase
VTPATFQALTGKPVVTDLWDASFANNMAHIELSRGADAIVDRPGSADFIAKLAHGIADDLLSTACLARNCPLLVAPAMNREMWDNPATQRNVATLRADGVTCSARRPATRRAARSAWAACSSPRSLERDARLLRAQAARGTQGARHRRPHVRGDRHGARHHQPVSGKMGYAIAEAAAALGADVTLVSGPRRSRRPPRRTSST